MSDIRIANAEARVKELLEYFDKLTPDEYPKSIRAFCRDYDIDLGSFRTANVWRPLFMKVYQNNKWALRAKHKQTVETPDVLKRQERSQQMAAQRAAKIRKVLSAYAEEGQYPKSRAEVMRRANLRDQVLDHPLMAEVRDEVRTVVAKYREQEGLKAAANAMTEAEYERLRAQNEERYRQAAIAFRMKQRKRGLGV